MSPEEHREVFREGWNAAVAEAVRAIPTTWLDPLLTGPDGSRAIGSPPYDNHDIERLLFAVRSRLRALKEKARP